MSPIATKLRTLVRNTLFNARLLALSRGQEHPMTQYIPLNLQGNNLGERHRHLNAMVKEAFLLATPFDSIKQVPELTLADKLFKIDLASKYKNVDYIFENLKNADMLFVSRAMKCTWLLDAEYKDKVNAKYLEQKLFPEMTTTAVNKMLHWIQHNLRDSDRCKDFYVYYKEKQFKIAIKFLWHCSREYLLEEFRNIIDKIDARTLKVLSEKSPQLTKIYYENLEQNRNMLKRYLDNEKDFFNNIKYVLKSDPETFFHVVEKYFNVQKCKSFGPEITKHIILNHKNRFLCKPELYTAWLLDMKCLAMFLSNDEVKEVVLKLARAEYLNNWFSYQKVEPLMKQLKKDEKVAFKQLVFVDKAIGDRITKWLYAPPSPPVMKEIPCYNLFADNEFICEGSIKKCKTTKRMIGKRCCKRSAMESHIRRQKTPLDNLFDHYRFMSFNATLFELRKRIRAESNLQNREYMALVLISKSGGKEDNIKKLFELLSQYRNEPVHFRAAIIRSLVKRAFMWRISDDLWTKWLQWANGLGLDGSSSDIKCSEGVHAVVLRSLFTNQAFNPVISKMCFDNFTYFTEYQLTTAERKILRTSLPSLILAAAVSESGYEKEGKLNLLLCTLDGYKIPFDKFDGVIEAIAAAVQEDPESTENLLIQLYNRRVARKYFFKENFSVIHDNASYTNALRHNISVIKVEKFVDILESENPSSYEPYLKKLVVYFGEPGGLAEQFYSIFKNVAEIRPNMCLAKPLALLAGKNFNLLLETLDKSPDKSAEKRLAAALRATGHKARPRMEVNIFSWQSVGAKAIANIVSTSPRNEREEVVEGLTKCGRTIRLAISLIDNTDLKCSAFNKMALLRPGAALKMFLRYLEIGSYGSAIDTIWNIVKPLIIELDYTDRQRLLKNLEDIKYVPPSIAAEYFVLVYHAILKTKKEKGIKMLRKIENVCYSVNGQVFSGIVKDLSEHELFWDDFVQERYSDKSSSYIRIITKFTLLCESEESQIERLKYLELVFQRIEGSWNKNRGIFINLLTTLLETLKYNKACFDSKYVPCTPVFERVLAWLHSMLPIEKWFDMYIRLHLTIVYYKAARICISQKPEWYIGDLEDLNKGIDMFGTIFGIFVARDYKELQEKYFPSVREIYKKELMDYLHKYINYRKYDQSKERFVIAIIKSILNEKQAREAYFLGSYIFLKHEKTYFRYGYDLTDIRNIILNAKEDELRFCNQIEVDM